MRTFVHYDSEGAIQGLVAVDTTDGGSLSLVPEPDVFVDEVEGVDVDPQAPNIEAVAKIAATYRVDLSTSPPRRLAKK
jgi:hypothetical protein